MMAEQFFRPGSVDEACDLIADYPDAKLIAGGQSLSLLLRADMLDPEALIDISGLDDLSYIEADDDYLRIGGGTTWAALHNSDVAESTLPSVAKVSGQIGDVQVRNRGTIGGSLSHADPAADMGALLLCYDTEIVCQSANGRRVVPLDEFFQGMFETTLRDDELLTEVQVALPENPFGSYYEKFEYRKGGFSMVGVGATVKLDSDGERVDELRVGLANCGDTPLTVDEVTEQTASESSGDDLLADIEKTVTEAADPLGDSNASRDYKKSIAGKLAAKAVENAVEEAT